MEREGFTIPLLIGGATTSRVHTAVKIEPHYHGPTVHVLDASRAVGVAGNLLSDTLRDGFVAETREEYRDVREQRSKHRRRGAAPAARRRPAQPPGDRLARHYAAGAVLDRAHRARRLPARRAGAADRLDAVLPDLGAGRPLSRHPERPPGRPGGDEPLPRRAGAARPDRAGAAVPRPRRARRLFRANAVGDDIELYADDDAHRAAGRHPHPAPADAQAAGPAQPRARRLRGARGRPASRTTSAPSP